MAITRINEFHAVEGKGGELKAALKVVMSQVKEAPGCQRCRLMEDPTNPTRLAIFEKWDDVEAHQAAADCVTPAQQQEIQLLLADAPIGRYYRRAKKTKKKEKKEKK